MQSYRCSYINAVTTAFGSWMCHIFWQKVHKPKQFAYLTFILEVFIPRARSAYNTFVTDVKKSYFQDWTAKEEKWSGFFVTSTECIEEEEELCILVVGLDNIILFWSKSVHIYPSIFVKSVPCAATVYRVTLYNWLLKKGWHQPAILCPIIL